MKNVWKRLCAGGMSMVLALTICGCATRSKQQFSELDPKNPTTVTVWNYYNGDQLEAFDKLVDEFNSSVGAEKGVVVVSISQGDIGTLADSLIDSAEGKAGAQELPTLASVYSETAYILNKGGYLAPYDPYFTKEELSSYVSAFLDEGRFNEKNELLQFPISKSTEVFAVNETDWNVFSDATGVTIDSIKTQEDLVAAAKAYYEWTDSLTPDMKEDGKALYGRDSVANYIYVGSNQLGHEIFKVDNGKLTIDLDRDTFKTLWDEYYIPYINGYFGAYANFRSEDAKTGKIIALTSSTSSMSYLPNQVTLEDDTTHDISMLTKEALPFANAVNDVVVQQGASFCMLKSSEAQQQGASIFLKWFTEPERNMTFSLQSSYSPVTTESNNEEAITKAYNEDTSTQKGQNVLNALLISADVFTHKTPYATKPFEGSKEVRSIIDSAISDTADQDRKTVEEAIASGSSREDAVAPFSTDEYFDTWFQNLSDEIQKTVGQN